MTTDPKNNPNKRGLGRGLGALLPSAAASLPARSSASENKQRTYFLAGIEQLYPSPEQPRRKFDEAQLAELGARYDAELALAEATAAHTKVDASKEGEKAARTWVASVLQNEAIGTAESRDLVDAYVGWFTLRAQWATAVVAWNVAVVRLGRATGEFRAAGSRPR